MDEFGEFQSANQSFLRSVPRSLNSFNMESQRNADAYQRFTNVVRKTGSLISRGLNLVGLAPGAADELTRAVAFLSESAANRNITGLPETTKHLLQLSTSIMQSINTKNEDLVSRGRDPLDSNIIELIDLAYEKILVMVGEFKSKRRTDVSVIQLNQKINEMTLQIVALVSNILLDITTGRASPSKQMFYGGGGLGLMRKYGVLEVRDDLYNALSKTANKENTEALSRAMYYLNNITDKAKYAKDISNIALHLTLRGGLGERRVWNLVINRMRRLRKSNVHVNAIYGVIEELQDSGNEALKAMS